MPPNPEQVQRIFLAAVDRDGVDRLALLEGECGQDSELRQRVECLLDAHSRSDQVLDRSPLSGDLTSLLSTESVLRVESSHALDARWRGLDEDLLASLKLLETPTQPGTLGRLGHYEIREVVGSGGFGVVLKAFDEKLQRIVAIKLMSAQMAATSPARKRFLREAWSAAAVRHENVAQIYAIEEEPVPYLVMEFIPGETLQQRLNGHGPMPVDEMLPLAIQIARGLAAAHAQGLIHRDIKPANILLEPVECRQVSTDMKPAFRSMDFQSVQFWFFAKGWGEDG